MTFLSPPKLFLIFYGTGFEVFKVMRVYNAVWVRTLYHLVYSSEYFVKAFWAYLCRLSREMAVCCDHNLGTHQWYYTDPQPRRLLFWILILCILHALCLTYLLQTNWIHVSSNKYTLLVYRLSNQVYSLIRVFRWVVIIWKCVIF